MMRWLSCGAVRCAGPALSPGSYGELVQDHANSAVHASDERLRPCIPVSVEQLTFIGHMSHPDLLAFFARAKAALRPPTPLTPSGPSASTATADIAEESGDATAGEPKMSESFIFVKENCCPDDAWGKGTEFLDPADSSLTRYVLGVHARCAHEDVAVDGCVDR